MKHGLAVAALLLGPANAANLATRQWLNNTMGAVYLDGSVPAYYVKREADATKWVIWQKGEDVLLRHAAP